jgi:hypothetical protein
MAQNSANTLHRLVIWKCNSRADKTSLIILLTENNDLVGFQVFTAVVMKSNTCWDVTPCSPSKVSRRFGGTYRQLVSCTDDFWSWRWRRYIPPNHRFTFSGLHGVISQKLELLIMILLPSWCRLDWIHLAQDRGQWRALVNTVIKFRVPWNVGKFLSGCSTRGLLKKGSGPWS